MRLNDDDKFRLTYAEISTGALTNNYQELRRLTSPSAEMMAVVKADGYGHGSVEVSRVALENGVTYLAVARLHEAEELRMAGITAPILLFGYCPTDYVDYLVEHDIRTSVNSYDGAKILSDKARQMGLTLKVHLKIDTGMGRLGVVSDRLLYDTAEQVDRAVGEIIRLVKLPNIEVEGIYTHFANADALDKTHAMFQFELFSDILDLLRLNSVEIPIRHAANSAAIIDLPETHLDMVRLGIAQYGLWPSRETDKKLINLQPAMTIKTQVIQIKEVPRGFKVSYGSTYEAPCETKLATVPIGYADGYDRALSSKGYMLIRGRRVPVVGRVCMDLTVLDVGHLETIELGDEVVALGRQGDGEINAEEIADQIETINYEIVSAITARIKRIYVD